MAGRTWTSYDNPFALPNGGLPDPMVGRRSELAILQQTVDSLDDGRETPGVLFRGCRGIGKTVLLLQFSEECYRRGWIVISFRGGSHSISTFEQNFSLAIQAGVREALGKPPASERRRIGTKITATGHIPFTGVDVTVDHSFDPTSLTLSSAESLLYNSIGKVGMPVVIIVDEADFVAREQAELMRALLRSLQPRGRSEYPTTLIAAGTSRHFCSNMAGTSTDTEFSSHNIYISRLTDEDAKSLLIDTAACSGEDWRSLDLSPLTQVCRGIPRRLQVAGGRLITTSITGGVGRHAVQSVADSITDHLGALWAPVDDREQDAFEIARSKVQEKTGLPLRSLCEALKIEGFDSPLKQVDHLLDRGLLEVDNKNQVYLLN